MNKKIKILHYGDANNLPTGYANESRYILEYLSNKPSKYEVIHAGWHYHGMPIKDATFEDGEKLNYWMHPAGNHPWGKDTMQQYVQKFKPDIFFILCDSFMLAQDGPSGPVNYWFNQINFSPAKTVLYFPSDGEPFPQGCENVLKKFDYNVAMAKFGQEQVKRLYNIDTLYIPHMVDCNKFYKLNNKLDLKKKWSNKIFNSLGQRIDISNKRIVLYVGRNQGRKFVHFIPKVASLFTEDKYKDVIFLCKCDPYDPASGGVDLISLSKNLSVADKVFFTDSNWFNGYTITDMREVYNLAEMYITPSSGEGFGICHIEAMASELPTVMTNFTTPSEQVDGDNNQLADMSATITGTYNVERGILKIEDMANKIKFFLDNPDVAKETGKKNRIKVLKEYDTKIVLPKWSELFDRIVWE